MKLHSLVLIVFVLFLGACDSDAGSFSKTKTYRQMRHVHAEGPDEILRESVFSLVQGKTREEAINFLRRDGATCSGNICSWQYIKRETAFDTWGVRPQGPLRAWVYRNTIEILSGRVLDRADIAATFYSEEIAR